MCRVWLCPGRGFFMLKSPIEKKIVWVRKKCLQRNFCRLECPCRREKGDETTNQPTKTMNTIQETASATLIYKARESEWLVITEPDTPQEEIVATVKTKEIAEGLCRGMAWVYTIAE